MFFETHWLYDQLAGVNCRNAPCMQTPKSTKKSPSKSLFPRQFFTLRVFVSPKIDPKDIPCWPASFTESEYPSITSCFPWPDRSYSNKNRSPKHLCASHFEGYDHKKLQCLSHMIWSHLWRASGAFSPLIRLHVGLVPRHAESCIDDFWSVDQVFPCLEERGHAHGLLHT